MTKERGAASLLAWTGRCDNFCLLVGCYFSIVLSFGARIRLFKTPWALFEWSGGVRWDLQGEFGVGTRAREKNAW